MNAGSATLLGLDFSCAPTRRKPLTLAQGVRVGPALKLLSLEAFATLDEWTARLTPAGMAAAGWHHGFVMGCDFPFGLPRPFVQALAAQGPGDAFVALRDADGSTAECDRLVASLHAHCGDRAGFQRLIDGWGVTWDTERPSGGKLLHRMTDRAVPGLSSTSPLQTRYVPVGKMYFEGMKRLVDANVSLPGLRTGRPDAVALEAYPGFLAGEILGRRSYKSDSDATPERLIARMDLIDALEQGRTRLGLRLKLSPAQRDHLAADPKGDRLDAVLCLLQAAWAQAQADAGAPPWGQALAVDPVEGWILTA